MGAYFLGLVLMVMTATGDSATRNSAKRNSCDLAPGDSVIVNQDKQESPTLVPRHFKLTRDRYNQKLFYVDLPVTFVSTSPVVSELYDTNSLEARDELREYFLTQTTACFESVNGRLKSSDGTEIRLRLVGGHDIPLINNTIEIGQGAIRSNFERWRVTIDCPTMIHESFHLLGLTDGYKESSLIDDSSQIAEAFPRFTPKHEDISGMTKDDCRAREPEESIMNNQVIALESENPYPLFPAHSRFITQPFCDEQNIKYITCAQNSNRTRAVDGCLKTPAYCENFQFLR